MRGIAASRGQLTMAKREVAVSFGFVKCGQGRMRRRMSRITLQSAQQPAATFFLLTIPQKNPSRLVAPLRTVWLGHDLGGRFVEKLQILGNIVQLRLNSLGLRFLAKLFQA